MNADILLKYFDRISEAPDAIPRLRRFILDLAVRGKLVEQDSRDEPAGKLLKRIQAEKAKSGITPRRQGSKEGEKLGDLAPWREMSFAVPVGWVVVRFGDVFSLEYGNNLPAEKRSNTGEYPVYGSNGVVGSHFEAFVSSPCLVVGRKGSAGALNLSLTDGCCVTDVAYYCIPPNGLDLAFSFKLFHTLGLDALGKGVKPGLSRNEAYVLPIALPPLAEQQRIVAKVDELMALCDQLVAARNEREARRQRLTAASLHRLDQPADAAALRANARFHLDNLTRLTTRPEQIKQLRQTILNLAVRGCLVPQDPQDDPITVLLESIKLDQHNAIKKGTLKKNDLSKNQEIGEFISSIPDSWSLEKLASLITFGPQNGVSPKETKDETAPKALTLTATTSGYFNSSYFKHIELLEKDCENYWLSAGDVLFQRGNTREYVGMAAIFDGPERSYVFPDLMIRVRFSKNVDLRFAHIVLISPPLRHYFSDNASGASTTMPKINQTTLLNAPFPLPPLAEQHRIVAKVDELMALCDQLEAQLTTATDSRRLLEAVLRDAIRPRAQA